MRIAGGVIMLIVGLWSVVGGSCSIGCGAVGGVATEGAAKFSSEMMKAAQKAGAKVDAKAAADAAAAFEEGSNLGSGFRIAGIVILIGGILCVVAGILFLVNKGKTFAFAAAGIGILGEIIFFALVVFNVPGVLKLALLAFSGFAATKIGEPSGPPS